MSKISELSDGGSLLPTDDLVAVRSGANVKVKADNITVDRIDLGDNEKIRLGDSQDLQIYHDGSNSRISDQGAGNLIINAGEFRVNTANDAEAIIKGDTDGAVKLYYDGSQKLATTSTGIDVTGTAVTDGLTVDTAIATSTASFRATTNSTTIGQKIGSLDFFNGTTNAAGTLEVRRASGGNAYSDMALMASANGNRSNQLLLSTTGDISFYEDTGTTPKLFWDASAASLFIGATSASALNTFSDDLIVSNTTAGTGAGISIVSNATNGYSSIHFGDTDDADIGRVQYNNATNEMTFRTNTSDAITIDSSQNVGIGTSSPLDALHIVSAVSSDYRGNLFLDDSTTGFSAGVGGQITFGAEYRSNGEHTEWAAIQGAKANSTDANYAGTLEFKTRAQGGALQTKMVLDDLGNVGIGTSSPSSFYTHAQNLVVGSGSGGEGLTIYSGSSDSGYIGFNDTASNGMQGFIQYNHNGDYMAFAPNGTEKVRIDSSGQVGIGVTSPSSYYANELVVNAGGEGGLTLVGDITHENYLAFADGTTGADRYSGYLSYNHGSNFMRFATNGGIERMRISSAGDVGIGTTPSYRLHVLDSAADIALFSSSHATTTNFYINNTNATANNTANLYFSPANAIAGAYISAIAIEDFSTSANRTADLAFYTRKDGTFGERVRIDSSGNLLVGATTTANLSDGTGNDGVQLNPSGTIAAARTSNVTAVFNRLSSDGEIARFNKDGSTVGSIGVRNGTNLYIAFRTEANGDGCGLTGSGASDGAIIASDGDGSAIDDHIDLGASGTRFDDIYATNGTIQTSDRNEKQDIEELSDAEQRVAVACKGLLRKFRWKSSVAENGDDARIHFGIIAQDLQAAFEAEGLDAGRYAMFINSTWTDEETGEERSRMGVRYSELLAFIIAAL